jgi:uncharacterized caspase-like protein
MKKIMYLFCYLVLILILLACGQGKYYLLKDGAVGLSNVNVFSKHSAPYHTSVFNGTFKNQFNPLNDDVIYYYISLLKGRVWKTEDFELKTIWYAPDGKEYRTIKKRYSGKNLTANEKYTWHIFRHKILTDDLADHPGKWRVELYIMGELSRKEHFTILPTKVPYTVRIGSTPPGADIYLDDTYKGQTPANIETSKGWHNIKLKKDGYQDLEEGQKIDESRDYYYTLERNKNVDNEPTEKKHIAHFPKMNIGDMFLLKEYTPELGIDTYHAKIIEVKSDGSFVIEAEAGKGGIYHQYYNNEYQLKKTVNMLTGKKVALPIMKLLNFPLFVGKAWTDQHIEKSGSSYYNYSTKYFVENYEIINTEAGSFEAFKITRQKYNNDTGWEGKDEYWYSPDAKVIVKSKPDWRLGRELLSYKMAEADTGPPKINISSPINDVKTVDENILLHGRIVDNRKVAEFQIRRGNEIVHHENKDLFTFQEKKGNAVVNVCKVEKEITLDEGRNDIVVEATDKAGNKAQQLLTVYRIKPLVKKSAEIKKLAPLSQSTTSYAVIIGIGTYQDTRIPFLKYTTSDAQAMYTVLTDPRYGGFPEDHVKLLLNEQATNNHIKSVIGTWLKRTARKNDTVIIFFAGHGAPEDEKTYWVTYNADIDDLYGTALSNDEIADMLDRVKAKKMIAFLDSCYSAATINRTDTKRKITIINDPFKTFKGKGRVIITSSDGKEQSVEIEKFGHGVFTYYLLKALKGAADENSDGYIELDEVWDYVKYRVPDTARKHGSTQTPILDGSYSAGIILSKHPERLHELYLQAEQEEKERELAAHIVTLKALYMKGELTSRQFDKAVTILKTGEKNKLLDDFLTDKISLTTFQTVFK